ncbi:MAG: DUF4846 domain-containing protein [Deltaproteobacteria bacterium]|nr:DUF4846 domain-containing protein [Deltaproteobacteria bacterium]
MLSLGSFLVLATLGGQSPAYPWLEAGPGDAGARSTIASRFAPPTGFERAPVASGSFAAWLRELPLHEGRGEVHLHDGSLKANQAAHLAIVDIDVGARDLQQCADAVMRLRAEYLLGADQPDEICFRFTDGTPAAWSKWRDGWRPKVGGKKTTWTKAAKVDSSHASFRKYLDAVFTYAGTASLERELERAPSLVEVAGGDVFIEPGFPGHAVVVADVAAAPDGRRAVLLAQSYMPAQQIHVLDNPAHPGDPWYVLVERQPLQTPEWRFEKPEVRRFGKSCQ